MVRLLWNSRISIQKQNAEVDGWAYLHPHCCENIAQHQVHWLRLILLILYLTHFMDSPYERQTLRLRQKDSLNLIRSFHHLSKLSRDRKFANVEEAISEIQNNYEFEKDDPLLEQIQYMKAFCQAVSNNSEESEKYCDKVANGSGKPHHRLRALLLKFCSKLKNGESIEDDQINVMTALIKLYPPGKIETMQRLYGCKYTQRMKAITIQEIDELTPERNKKAIKLQIAADWKFCLGKQFSNEAISMKTEALKIWKNINRQNKYDICLNEQKAIIQLSTGYAVKSPYAHKLLSLTKILKALQKIDDPRLQIAVYNSFARKAAVKTLLPKYVRQLVLKQISNSPSKSKGKSLSKSLSKSKSMSMSNTKMNESKASMGSASEKKTSECAQRKQAGQQFISEAKSNNFYCIDFMPENRLEFVMKTEITKKIGIFNSIIKKYYRYFYNRLQNKEEEDEDKYTATVYNEKQ